MLLHLSIRDFAIIDAAELDFPAGFTVVTGETGAGKSILVNALTLVLGGRASAEVVRAGAKAAEVEALFDISAHPVIRARLEQRELVGDDVDTLIVRRVMPADGRGKVLINGHISTVATLGEIVRGLVDISGQHEQQSLLLVDGHLDLIDAFGDATLPAKAVEGSGREAYRCAYEGLRGLLFERAKLTRSQEENLSRADYLRFQLEEIERLAPRPGEDLALDAERRRLAHAEKLKGGAQLAEALVYGDDGSAFDKLGKAAAEVQALGRIDPALTAVAERLAAARAELEEAARELSRYGDGIEADPARLEDLESRCAELSRLGRKHGGGVAEILKRGEEIGVELEQLEHAEGRLEGLGEQISAAEVALVAAAKALTTVRTRAAAGLEAAVAAELADMDLEGATFIVRVQPRRPGPELLELDGLVLGPSGGEDAELLWSANPGEPPRALARIASGGELSRLMLAVKGVLSNRDLVSLYVFDEVDTGLGGRAADRIARKIQRVAKDHQAITITHLAPIAAYADHHLLVAKALVGGEAGDRTVSSFAVVDGKSRAEEIARMIDGAGVTKATRQAAKEMLARR